MVVRCLQQNIRAKHFSSGEKQLEAQGQLEKERMEIVYTDKKRSVLLRRIQRKRKGFTTVQLSRLFRKGKPAKVLRLFFLRVIAQKGLLVIIGISIWVVFSLKKELQIWEEVCV